MPRDEQCPLCRLDSESSSEIRRRVILGKLDPEVVAAKYDMTARDVMEHVYHHIDDQNMVEEVGGTLESYYFELKTMFSRMNNWFKMVMVEDLPDGDAVRQATALSKEMRETLKLLAEIEGIIGSRAKTENEEELRHSIESLKNILFTCLCPACQARVIEEMEV